MKPAYFYFLTYSYFISCFTVTLSTETRLSVPDRSITQSWLFFVEKSYELALYVCQMGHINQNYSLLLIDSTLNFFRISHIYTRHSHGGQLLGERVITVVPMYK